MGDSTLVRFSLRTLLLLVAVSAMAAAMIAHFFFRPDPITHITTHSEWDAAIKNGRCIVFVDGDWNIYMGAFRKPFARFAIWCQTHTDVRALTMLIDSADTTNDVWNICDQLWRTNNISSGGLKNLGGAGRVLWIDNGQVVDYAWCMELINFEDIENIDALKARTRNAFNCHGNANRDIIRRCTRAGGYVGLEINVPRARRVNLEVRSQPSRVRCADHCFWRTIGPHSGPYLATP